VAVAAATNADPLSFILGGGEDHSLLATFPDAAVVPEGWTVIGAVSDGEVGVTVDGAAYDGPVGWTHF
jgi:thiamine-monophosphate kinase